MHELTAPSPNALHDDKHGERETTRTKQYAKTIAVGPSQRMGSPGSNPKQNTCAIRQLLAMILTMLKLKYEQAVNAHLDALNAVQQRGGHPKCCTKHVL